MLRNILIRLGKNHVGSSAMIGVNGVSHGSYEALIDSSAVKEASIDSIL